MTTKSDINWFHNYDALKAYIKEHGHLPDKHLIAALCSRGRSIKDRRLSKASLIQRNGKCLSHYYWLLDQIGILGEGERIRKINELNFITLAK